MSSEDISQSRHSVSNTSRRSYLPVKGANIKKHWTIVENQISEITELDISEENNTDASLP